MMKTHDFGYYVESALRVRSKDFDIANLLHGNSDRDVWFSHFLLEADRLSPMGLGGQAFRHWVAGLYRNGVYVYTDNYRIGLSIASDPNARPLRGCQESRAHGNPWPGFRDGGGWLSVLSKDVPAELKERVVVAANEMVHVAAGAVILRGWQLKCELEAERAARVQEKNRILAAWGV